MNPSSFTKFRSSTNMSPLIPGLLGGAIRSLFYTISCKVLVYCEQLHTIVFCFDYPRDLPPMIALEKKFVPLRYF